MMESFVLILQQFVKPRHAHTVTGLPDAYSRGRIIGVYARLALYGADYLMKEKAKEWDAITEINEENIRLKEEINMQYQALQEVCKLWCFIWS